MNPATVIKKGDVDNYTYAYLPTVENIKSSSSGLYGNDYGVYGSSVTKEANPGSMIEGLLLKRGIISVSSVDNEKAGKTLIVRYGESGRRDILGGLGGYTLEVTIMMIDASTDEIVYSCVAEGQGSTETDDIREAVHRCLADM
jgi:hypothetical protein